MSTSLAERRILLTRPSGQGEALAARLRELGARVLCRPTLAIEAVAPTDPSLRQGVDWLVFTSPNAVTCGRDWLMAAGLPGAGSRVAAVGPGTAAAARQAGFRVAVAPAVGGGADDLLAEPGFAPRSGQRVLLVRGEGGRRRLQRALADAGVSVVEAVVYRRVAADVALRVPPDWQAVPLDVTIVTSAAGLQALLGMAGPDALRWLHASRLVTVSRRVADVAVEAGFAQPVVAAGASDGDLTAATIRAVQRDAYD